MGSHPVDTPAVSFFYDGKGLSAPQNPNFGKGKLTKVTSSVSETRYKLFDSFGRLMEMQQRTPFADELVSEASPRVSKYTYNFSGALVEEEYPSGRKVKNEYESDGDLARVFGKANANTTERTYANSFGYTASGGISRMRLGNGHWETASFNTRMQVTDLGLGMGPSGNRIWHTLYEYGELSQDGNSVNDAKNTGNIARQTLSVPGTNFVQSYSYDALYRLTGANEKIGTNVNWTQTWNYDVYGNRTSFVQNLAGQSTNATPAVDANTNRFTSTDFNYDANGNLVGDVDPVTSQTRQFVFNGDNKQTQVKDDQNNPIGTYYYDGEGKRIKKVVGNETTVFVYSGGKLIAEYSTETPPLNPTTSYTITDQLGSPRVIVNALGEVVSRRDFMPFGEEISPDETYRKSDQKYGQTDSVRQKFTGYQHDEETELDFAEARMYENRHGRFAAVDPLLASGKSANPQTFNRFVYVGNRPLTITDPLGLDWYWRNDPDKEGRKLWQWFDDAPTKDGWAAVDFGIGNGYFQVSNATYDSNPLGTIYLNRYGNSYLNQSEYAEMQQRDSFSGRLGLTFSAMGKSVGNSALNFSNGFWWGVQKLTFDALQTPRTALWQPTNDFEGQQMFATDLALLGLSVYSGGLATQTRAVSFSALSTDLAGKTTLPIQTHHFATIRNQTYTPKMAEIAKDFGLSLEGSWNTQALPHLGRHPNRYHEFVLRGMQDARAGANGSKAEFLRLFDLQVKQPVIQNPQLLRRAGWSQ